MRGYVRGSVLSEEVRQGASIVRMWERGRYKVRGYVRKSVLSEEVRQGASIVRMWERGRY